MAATCSSRGSRSNRSSEALAAAQASGLAMKVGPCISACVGSSEQKASNTALVAIVAASPMVPPVSALESAMMSGTTPAASQANSVPVRPKPVNTSSKINSRPCRSAARRELAQYLRRMKDHAARALRQRLDDDRRQRRRMGVERRLERRLARLVGRQIDDDLLRQHAGEKACMPSSGSQTDMAANVSP